ncbi:GH32 C-terminal domain-containing protein [Gracilibacillus sp. S3-1-1]|uniref:GH32 C-terminal domain-containing protein n=1 Tax=Gracilibacillus pellucidus TaxID=3095368 RepID=A0ACC6M9E4_9BACI|nr:GH32 C-terminal domain-containing protein [Gracilibacillus sp. S3-1-1]MDX8047564.1 GH32 C-terminal domain-containing protein [Gracilibacillus sp. S3-1-1]
MSIHSAFSFLLYTKEGKVLKQPITTANKRWIILGSLIIVIIILFTLFHNTVPSYNQQNESYSYRANYHFTVPQHWKNDPQRPIYLNGKYYYYYLYNGDYPEGNGTEWRLATSKDLVNWDDQGVAIPKYTNENGDAWSGSVVIDHNNTAGLGENSLIALVTQPSTNGIQAQYLWYSTDEGQTFQSLQDEPVMANPNAEDFRDPKIIWDEVNKQWVLLMAEGAKVGFYVSTNLQDWQYTADFQTEDIGIVECPDLFQLRADDGSMRWIMGVSANGLDQGKPNTYAYWIGDFDGNQFIADHKDPKWLDYGFDWYGGVTFEDGESDDYFSHRYALAWMNNWAYADQTPTQEEGFNGLDSIVRKIELKKNHTNGYYLVSQPIQKLNQLINETIHYPEMTVDGTVTLDDNVDSYQLSADISWDEAKNIGLRLRESANQERHIDVGFFPQDGYSYVNRTFTNQPDDTHTMTESTAPMDPLQKDAHIHILVDKTSIEVFLDDGEIAYSNLVFPRPEDQGISLFSEDGQAVFKNVEIHKMDAIE